MLAEIYRVVAYYLHILRTCVYRHHDSIEELSNYLKALFLVAGNILYVVLRYMRLSLPCFERLFLSSFGIGRSCNKAHA